MYTDHPFVRDSEGKRRVKRAAVEYSSIQPGTPLSKDMDTVWPFNSNKCRLEKSITSNCEKIRPQREYSTVLGQVTVENDWQNIILHEGRDNVLPHL